MKNPTIWLMSLGCFVCVAGSVFFYETNVAKIFSVVLGTCFAIGGIALLHPGRTIINFSKRTLRREILFLGQYTLWCKDFSFGEFNSIVINQRIGGDRDNCFIGLSRLSGRKFWLKYFENTPDGFTSSQAEEFANQLSHELQLPINKIG